MKQLSILCCFFLALMGEHTIAQTTFRHTATAANIEQNWTYLDHSEINNNPNALLEVTANYGSGVYHAKAIGVWYSAGRWTIFNQDRTPMTLNAQFNVLIAPSGTNAFRHTSSETSGHITIINNSRLNNNPNAKFLVTQNWGEAGPYNPNPIGVYYTGGRWAIYNQNLVAMPRNAKFNIFLNDNIFVAEATAITSNYFFIDNPITNNRPAALVFATQYWTGVYNPNEIGVWYFGGKWSVFNQNLIAMPQQAKFMIWSPSASTPPPTTITIPAATWRNALNSVFTNSCVRLNNYTPNQNQYDRNERQFYRPNDSYLKLVFNGTPVQYPIPIDVIQTGPDNMYKMYVNDWNTHHIIASNEGNRIKISLLFEGEGTEIIGNCYNNFWCGSSPAPNFNYSDAVIDIYLDLAAARGQISYNATNRFTANVAESGPCVNNFFAIFCPSNRSGLIKTTLENKLNEHLNSNTVKSLMGILFAQLLPSGTVVNRVTMTATGDIIVE